MHLDRMLTLNSSPRHTRSSPRSTRSPLRTRNNSKVLPGSCPGIHGPSSVFAGAAGPARIPFVVEEDSTGLEAGPAGSSSAALAGTGLVVGRS